MCDDDAFRFRSVRDSDRHPKHYSELNIYSIILWSRRQADNVSCILNGSRKSLNWAQKPNIPIDPFAFCHAQCCALFIFGIHRSSNERNGMIITAGNWSYGKLHKSEWCVREGKKIAKVRGVCDIDICTLLFLIIYRHYSSIGGVVASTSWMRLAAIGVEFTCVAAIIVRNVFVCSERTNSQAVTTVDSRVYSHLTHSFCSISICVCGRSKPFRIAMANERRTEYEMPWCEW